MAYLQLIKNLLLLALLQEIRTEFLLPSNTCNIPNGICETRCRCKEGFIALNESCLGKIGTSCTMQSDCIPEAACVDTFGGGRCTCNDGLVAYSNNTECRLKVGTKCASTNECIQHAVCKGHTCTCEDMYAPSEDKSTCIGYVGAICDEQSGTCVANAKCMNGHCACLNGYQVEDYTCKAKVGTICAATNECIRRAVCTGYTCSCKDTYTPSADSATCIGHVGALCDQYSGTCVENAECINNGQCACKNGYHADGNVSKTCKEKEDGSRVTTRIAICSAAGVLIVLAVVTFTIPRCRKESKNLC